jgi:hypothetical protein
MAFFENAQKMHQSRGCKLAQQSRIQVPISPDPQNILKFGKFHPKTIFLAFLENSEKSTNMDGSPFLNNSWNLN